MQLPTNVFTVGGQNVRKWYGLEYSRISFVDSTVVVVLTEVLGINVPHLSPATSMSFEILARNY